MRFLIFAAATATMLLTVPAPAQQSHWASKDDKTAKYIIDMERKWAEGVCVDNGVVSSLLADDFQGTSTQGARFKKAMNSRTRRGHAPLMIADSMRPKYISSETISPWSMAANMLSAKTSPSQAQRF